MRSFSRNPPLCAYTPRGGMPSWCLQLGIISVYHSTFRVLKELWDRSLLLTPSAPAFRTPRLPWWCLAVLMLVVSRVV